MKMNIDQKVKNAIVELVDNLKLSEIKLENHLINDLGFDSLNLVEFSMRLEDIFKIEINMEDFNLKELTVRSITESVRKLIAQR